MVNGYSECVVRVLLQVDGPPMGEAEADTEKETAGESSVVYWLRMRR